VQRKHWVFTWNAPESENTPDKLKEMSETLESVFRGFNLNWVFQTEVAPTTGRLHLQGYIESPNRIRWTQLRLPRTIHWEPRRGTQLQAIEYNSDPEKRMPDGWISVNGIVIPEKVDVITPNRPWQLQILAEIQMPRDDRIINWYWSEEGGVGKTALTKFLVIKHGACLLGGKGSDVRNGIVKWKETKGDTPKLCVYNITRSFDPTYVSYEALENIKDMCFYSGKYEGAQIVGNPPHLYVFANYAPPQGKLSEDRLRVWQIVGPDAVEGHCVEPPQLA